MRTKPILAGLAAGVVLGAGGLAALDVTTEHADAQGDGLPELEAANERSIRAIKQGTKAWNLVAKYLAEPNERIAVRSPRISQDAGIGGGLPGAVIADGAVSEPKLDPALQAKVNSGGAAGTPGPAGPQGPPGADGATGPPGPTSGSASSPSAPDPLPAGILTLPSSEAPPTVETTTPGRLYVTANFAAGRSCSTVGSNSVAWILLDGDPVRSSYRRLADDSGQNYATTATGVTEDVIPAGTHSIQVALGCSQGGGSSTVSVSALSVAAIVLG